MYQPPRFSFFKCTFGISFTWKKKIGSEKYFAENRNILYILTLVCTFLELHVHSLLPCSPIFKPLSSILKKKNYNYVFLVNKISLKIIIMMHPGDYREAGNAPRQIRSWNQRCAQWLPFGYLGMAPPWLAECYVAKIWTHSVKSFWLQGAGKWGLGRRKGTEYPCNSYQFKKLSIFIKGTVILES